MAKIILLSEDMARQELLLTDVPLTLGRKSENDLVLEHPAVSARHAEIVPENDGYCLLDLDSTNGTLVNGARVRRHLLRHGDVIEIASFRIGFAEPDRKGADKPSTAAAPVSPAPSRAAPRLGVIEVLDGPNAGKTLTLTKTLATIGLPDTQVAVVYQRGDAYYLMHVEGPASPRINGRAIGAEACLMRDGDLIDFAETGMRFRMI
ncbi:FHA domain-containing protein [Noviherbaspirillum humi]|uniref:FHA domain-containing protein n=1 Tax=Noviherbaspirillum humi TaxID=1688639 RepID=A0A239E3I8_9BURK|nr:FHA domain-containing protein [Noviherbaspirillum humi]SNS38848.1 FHA domain-containing protein [Noviherbaspirillum humi]